MTIQEKLAEVKKLGAYPIIKDLAQLPYDVGISISIAYLQYCLLLMNNDKRKKFAEEIIRNLLDELPELVDVECAICGKLIPVCKEISDEINICPTCAGLSFIKEENHGNTSEDK